MTQSTLTIIVGGILPALFFGISSVFSKASTESGISLGFYILCAGGAAAVTGVVFCFFDNNMLITLRSSAFAALAGIAWAVAAGLVAVALIHYDAAISKLVPLYNMNTLVAVLIGLIVFSEWKDINVPKLFIGSLLIIIGGSLVSAS